MRDLVIQIAVSEILQPTLGVTKQVLAVHKIRTQDGNLLIAGIDESTEVGAYYVYFSIEDAPYYFVVVVRQESEKLIPSASYIEAAIRVYLFISSWTLNPEAIEQRIGLTSTRCNWIGDAKNPARPQVKFQEHRWYFEPQPKHPGSLEDQLTSFLDHLDSAQAEIARLQDECEISIRICYQGYRGWMGGWNLDRKTIQRIHALNADVDLDLYAFGEFGLP